MLYEYEGPLDISAFYITTDKGALVLLPSERRAGGPAVFTSPRRCEAFLRYYSRRWGELPNPRIRRLDFRLGEYHRRLVQNASGNAVLLIDPRPPVLPGDDLDSDFLPLSA